MQFLSVFSVVYDGVEGPEVKMFREGEENENKNQTSETTGRRIISRKQVAITLGAKKSRRIISKGEKVSFSPGLSPQPESSRSDSECGHVNIYYDQDSRIGWDLGGWGH